MFSFSPPRQKKGGKRRGQGSKIESLHLTHLRPRNLKRHIPFRKKLKEEKAKRKGGTRARRKGGRDLDLLLGKSKFFFLTEKKKVGPLASPFHSSLGTLLGHHQTADWGGRAEGAADYCCACLENEKKKKKERLRLLSITT